MYTEGRACPRPRNIGQGVRNKEKKSKTKGCVTGKIEKGEEHQGERADWGQ